LKIIQENDGNALDLAIASLRAGKVISFACDTVYGLAVDAANSKAVDGLYQIKKRDEKKPIAIFLKDLLAAEKLFYFDKVSKNFAEKFLPGSLTIIMKIKPESRSILAKNLNQNDDQFLGFRIIDYPFVKNLLTKFGGVLAVTSANRSNEKAAISADEVKKYFEDSNLDLLIDGGVSEQKIASTIVKIDDEKISILRQGALKLSPNNL
jgi:L-threonylcarbamoyladenylate synthase